MINLEIQASKASEEIDLLVAQYCGIGYSKDDYDKSFVREIILKALTAQHKVDMEFARWWRDESGSIDQEDICFSDIEQAREYWLKNVRGEKNERYFRTSQRTRMGLIGA